MIKAALKVKSTNLKFSFLCKKTSNNKIANTILDNAIVKVLNNLCSRISETPNPTKTIGIVATTNKPNSFFSLGNVEFLVARD